MRTHPSLTVKEADQFFIEEYDINVNERKIYQCIVKAREIIEGSEKAQYSLLRDYGDEILKCNPGSTVIIETTSMPDSDNLFKRIYICLHACKKAFLGRCRPFICLDGIFLKRYYGGQQLTAIGQDANNHIYLIAYAIVTTETKDSWKWFIQLLQEDLGDGTSHGFSFMSDQQKGLIPTLQKVMPGSHHRFCSRHIWKNFAKKWNGLDFKGALFNCAKTMAPRNSMLPWTELRG
ncbi:hypothetical protein AHAS_Ahas19G0114400 [Arachis hypogaea]